MRVTDDLRVLVVSPLARDAALIRSALETAGVHSETFEDIASATEAFRRRAGGALLIAEEALAPHAVAAFALFLSEQPAWSDVPVMVMTARGQRSVNYPGKPERHYLKLGNVTLLEAPMRVATLISSVNASLRARSRQYARKLTDDALRKSEKLAAVGRLAASIAHEINNPLEAMMNALYLLNGTPLNEQQRTFLNIARGELERVSEIASHTLTFNRQNDVRAEASVAEILDSVLTLYQARLAGSSIKVDRRFNHGEQLICYPGELRQVFANLIGNAFDATRTGGRIILRERAAVHPRSGQRGIRITVADTGTGINPDVMAHLFEAFNSDKGIHGTGLGLWVSKGIVDKHSGSIGVRSSTKPGHSGTVFSIFIPRDPRGAAESRQPGASARLCRS